MLKRFACLLALSLIPQAYAGELLIETRLADDGGLLVTYTPPMGIVELKRNRIDDVSNDVWKQYVHSLDDCAQVEATRIVLRTDPKCHSAHLKVEPVLMDRYANYEAALPMKGQGVLGFTGYYLAALKGHGLRWRWFPPTGGYVLHQGNLHREAVEEVLDEISVDAALRALDTPQAWERLGGQQYVYLGRAPTVEVPGGTLVYDVALDQARLGDIDRMLKLAMQSLGSSYGRWPAGPVGVVVTTAERNGFRGDVTRGRMMSLRLPLLSDTSQPVAQIQRFIAHEVTHWWNMGLFSSDSRQPWLHEGHAEWTALLLMRSRDQMSRDDALAQLEGALNRCISVRGDRPTATLNTMFGRGDDPYACGLSLMFLAQVQHDPRLQPDPQRSLLNSLAKLHTYGRDLDVAGFSAWADGASEGPMRRLLLDPNQSFETGVVKMVETLGLGHAQSIHSGTVLPPSVAAGVAENLMKVLMTPDCGGSSGFWRLPDAFKLDERLTCQTLRLGQEAVALNGVSLLREPARAWQVLTEKCSQHNDAADRPLTIQYRQGPATDLACPMPLPSMPVRYVISLEKSALAKFGI